jgi:stage II sporulation protein GA (sporulation sigma-E factor processing peptidase)
MTITMQLSSYKFKYRMVVLSSVLGSLYTLTVFFESLEIFTNIIFKILMVFIMVKIILRDKNIFSVIKVSGIFFLGSIAFSGFCFIFAMAENPYNIQGVFTIKNYSSKNLLFSSMILYVVAYRVYLYFKNRAIVSNFIYDLEFYLGENLFNVKGFLDTGNELTEPVTMLPVIILERKIAPNINIREEEAFYIPYKLVDGTSSRMKGIKVSQVKINNSDSQPRVIEAIIAFCDTRLSSEGDFNALLSRAVL